MQDDEFDWEHLVCLARRVAKVVVAKWDIVEADDVQQEVLEYVLERWGDVSDKAKSSDPLMFKIMLTAGEKYALRERAYRDLIDGNYYYTPSEARFALRQLSREPDEFSEVLGRVDDLSRCRITDNIHTACLEAKMGLEKINPRYRNLLVNHFVRGVPCSGKAEQKACQRGALALSREMNRSIRRNKSTV